jgi:hypothetical protein
MDVTICDELLALIKNETINYNKANTFHEKMERINNIIQLKIIIISDSNLSDLDLFIDVKRFLKDYTLSIEEGKHGYDKINFNSIYSYINHFKEEEQLSLIKYFMRILYLNGFEKEHIIVEDFKKNLEIKYYLKNRPYLHLIKIFYLLTTYSLWSISITIIIIILIVSILILPSPNWITPIFNIKTAQLCSNNYFNNLFNFVGSILKVNNSFELEPRNILGITVLILGKLFIIIFVINILIKEFTNKIKY